MDLEGAGLGGGALRELDRGRLAGLGCDPVGRKKPWSPCPALVVRIGDGPKTGRQTRTSDHRS